MSEVTTNIRLKTERWLCSVSKLILKLGSLQCQYFTVNIDITLSYVFYLVPPTIIQGLTETTVNVEEGGVANLTCDATGYPTPNISWVRANGDALPEPINKFRHKVNSVEL